MITLQKKDLSATLIDREEFLASLDNVCKNVVLLNTCNRVEIYSGAGMVSKETLHHLFRVTSGLESALLGETAIQGQVKEAYCSAAQRVTLSKELHLLFQNASRVGKRVRTETKISQGAMSHSQAVIEILKIKNMDIAKANILIIGATNINEKVLKHLIGNGNTTTFIANRTYAKAIHLAQKYNVSAARFDELYNLLPGMDIVISATAAPHFVVKYEYFNSAKTQIIFDLAFPRDIDPLIGNIPKITLLNIEDIERIINTNQQKRTKQMLLAEQIIAEEIQKYYAQN